MPNDSDNLSAKLFDFLSAPGYQPLKQHELAHALHLKAAQRSELRRLLSHLEREGRLACLRKNRWALARTDRLVTGKLTVNVQGFGFITPEGATRGEDLYVEREDMAGALHGDRVVAEIRGRAGGARRNARILRIAERPERTLTGILQQGRSYWYIIPDDPRIPSNVLLSEEPPADAAAGHQVAVRLDPGAAAAHQLTGRVLEVLGQPGAPGVDMLTVMRGRGLYQDFDPAVQAEATARSPELSAADLRDRLDLRDAVSLTIDPADAKDHDDAVSLEARPGGGWLLGVHIADVSHFVQPGTEVDREARHRGNSVYMVDRFIPMLPKHLTSEVCSLRPHVDRLTHSVLLELDGEGRVQGYRTGASVIHSRARLNYDQVQALLENRPGHGIPETLQPGIRAMADLSARIRRRRMQAGALNLNLPEVTCELDPAGQVIALHRRGAAEAYNLIEEFMLLANVAVAEIQARSEGPALYRIHEEPGEDQWVEMGVQLDALGVHLHPQDRADLQVVCRKVAGQPVEYAAQLAILRNLKRALYSPTLCPHFGLAFDRYTHFTSPIRRYPDLVVHRLLKALETRRRPPHSHEEIARLALHCVETERNADEAEQESLAVKRIAYYAQQLKAGEIGPWRGLIVTLVPKGLIVEVFDTLQRGLVAFAALNDDYYQLAEDRCSAVGRRSRKVWRLGQPVEVELVRVDTVRRQVDFRMVGSTTRPDRNPSRADAPDDHGRQRSGIMNKVRMKAKGRSKSKTRRPGGRRQRTR